VLTEAYLPRGAGPKRSLGQNFLVDAGIAHRMVDAMGLAGDETVVEIGGGRGAMTELLAGRAGRLVVVEIDRALAAGLAESFRARADVEVISGDILDIDPAARLDLRPGEKALVFGNIPYYASSPILIWLAEHAASFRRAYLTMQREVAERLTASPGEKAYGSITVRLAYAAASRRLFSIPPDAFRPRPKVVSSFVELAFHERPPVDVPDAALLFRVVRASFAQRRKTLRNTLALLPEAGAAPWLGEIAASSGIDLGRRGETLSLAEFARLATVIAEARCRA
jgi:16S rRNA (adenine1518-N6/adenine1519-N6)-dimethyltransferase